MKKGAAKVTHNAVTVGSSVKHNCTGYNALLIHHYIEGATSGGYVDVTMSNQEGGNFIAHHGGGENVKAADSATSYTMLLTGIMDWVSINLNVTDGTHTVIVQPLVL